MSYVLDPNRAKAELCRRSFFRFVQEFWECVIPETPVYNWHIPYLCQELEDLTENVCIRKPKKYDALINIPPGTTKSTIVTIMWPAWLWIKDPTLRIISNSYSHDLSIEHALKSRDIILSDKYKLFFPNVKIREDKGAKSSYENSSRGARYTTSTGGTITGIHGHIIINDDPINPKQALSDVKRKEAIEHTKTLSSRKVDKEITVTVTIMQRLHKSDPSGHILSNKGDNLKHICLPAEDSNLVKPIELREKYIDGLLDPKRLSKQILEESKIDLGTRQYAGQFGQSPTEDGGNIFKEDWFETISRYDFNVKRGTTPFHFFVDTAFTEKKTNDPTGIICTCFFENTLYISKTSKVYKKFPDLIKYLPNFVFQNGYDHRSTIRIEPKANGISVIDQLQVSTGLNVTRTPSPSDSKETRANAISPKVECKRVVLVEDYWNTEFIDEVCAFPNTDHDEYVDLLGYAVNYYMNGFNEWEDSEYQKALDLM